MSRKGRVNVKGEQVLLLGLVALVITAGYYRWTMESEKFDSLPVTGDAIPVAVEEKAEQEKNSEGTEIGNKDVAKLKEERDRSRGELIEGWTKTVQSSDATAEAKQDAQEKLEKATDASEKEVAIELLIQSKGFDDCFVQISDSGVTAVVSGGELNGSKVAQMKDIIVGETGVEVRNIKISAE